MRPPRCASGMTLIEVVLALALSAGLMGAALAFYNRAVAVRTGLEDRIRIIEGERMIMERITNELRGAMTYPFLGMGMEGGAEEIRFINPTLPGPAVWAVRKSTDEPVAPQQDLQIVEYRLRGHEDEETGQWVIDGLERTRQKIISALTVEGPPDERSDSTDPDEESWDRNVESALLCGGIKFLAFRYFQDGIWLESWAGGDLPVAVEITMGLEPLPEDTPPEEYPYPVFRRVVYLPGAGGARRGGVVRGPGRGG